MDSAKTIARKDKDLAQKLVMQAKTYSERDDFSFGIGRSVFTNGFISHVNGKKDQAIVYYLESLELLKDLSSSDAVKYKSFATRNIGLIFYDHYQFKNAFDYFDQSQKFAERLGSTEFQTIALYHKARSNRKLGLFEDAIDNLFDASELALDDKDYEYLINVNNQLGLIFKEIEKYDKAIEHYYRAFKYKSELKDFNRFAGTAYHNIAATISPFNK
ncbi:MAG: tetratricopeptide repeat protein [Bacteroidota bacterium]